MNVSLFSLRSRIAAFSALALALTVSSAHADVINVVNGGFETTTLAGSGKFNASSAQQVTGWTSNGYNFVYTATGGDTNNGQNNAIELWGPANGSNNGLTASPLGGNYLALDGAYSVGAVSQTLSGLTVGAQTTVNFYFAGAQQSGFSGITTEQLKVSLGSQSLYTEILTDPTHGFTGWKYESLTFTATSTTEVLSFLAIGTPAGVPPMSLLDGVSVTSTSPVPEPSSIALMMTGLAGFGGYVRSRFKK
jgi:hypothetical protein